MTRPGLSLGRLPDFGDGTATKASYEARGRRIALMVVRRGGALRAFLDLCPHQYLPLGYRGNQILSKDGERLRCTSHGAEFSAADGSALAGPVRCGLTAVALRVDDDGMVWVDDGSDANEA